MPNTADQYIKLQLANTCTVINYMQLYCDQGDFIWDCWKVEEKLLLILCLTSNFFQIGCRVNQK